MRPRRSSERSAKLDLTAAGSRGFAFAMSLLLVLCWILGGVTVDDTSADELLQLIAIPVLAWAAWRLTAAAAACTWNGWLGPCGPYR